MTLQVLENIAVLPPKHMSLILHLVAQAPAKVFRNFYYYYFQNTKERR